MCSDCSARSRVRGFLEIYHAYLRDTNNTQQIDNVAEERSAINNVEDSWEIVEGNEELPTQVRQFLPLLIQLLTFSLILFVF